MTTSFHTPTQNSNGKRSWLSCVMLIAFAFFFNSIGNAQTSIEWTNLTYATASGGTVTKSGAAGWISGASSKQMLYGSEDGKVTYVAAATNKAQFFGFTAYPNLTWTKEEIDYSFLCHSNGNLSSAQNGSTTSVGTYAVGDSLVVERLADKIYWIKNGTKLDSLTVDSTENLVVDVALNTSGAEFADIFTSFSTTIFDVAATTGPVPADESHLGNLSLSTTGGTGPYTYYWHEFNNYGSSKYNLDPGLYTITITDSLGRSDTRTFGVGYDAQWEDLTYAEVSGTALTKDGSNSWNSGASTKNALFPYQDGWMVHSMDTTVGYLVFGWSKYPNAGYSTSEAKYGFIITDYGFFAVRESGTNVTDGSYGQGDIFRLERIHDSVYYYRNEVLLRTVAVDPAEMLIGDAAMKVNDTELTDVWHSSNDLRFDFSPDFTNNAEHFDTLGAVVTNTTGGTGAYTYLWNPGGVGDHKQTSEETQNVELTIKDEGGNQRTQDFGVGYDVTWQYFVESEVDSDGNLTKTSSSNSWNAGATGTNYLKVGEDGWVEAVADTSSTTRVFGLTSLTDTSHSFGSVEFGWYLHSSGTLYYNESGNIGSLGSWTGGDMLRIERIDDTIYYYRNQEEMRVTAATVNAEYRVDAALHSDSMTLMNIRCSFLHHHIAFDPDITHQSLYEDYGSISVAVAGGYPPYTYSWSNGDTTATTDSLTTGTYTLTVTDTTGLSDSVSVEILHLATFVDMIGVDKTGTVLEKTETTNAYLTAGASSENRIDTAADGEVKAALVDPNIDLYVGLADDYVPYDYDEQNYAIVVKDTMLYSFVEGDALKAINDAGGHQRAKANDELRIERKTTGGTTYIYYYVNDTLKRTLSGETDTIALVVNIGFKSPGGKVKDVSGVFKVGDYPTFICNANRDRNYTEVFIYDENGSSVSHNVTFIDGLGRAHQSQSYDYVNTNVMVSKTVFDAHGRAVLSTLPAPSYLTDASCYKAKFITNDDGDDYSYTDFDLGAKVDDPDGVNQNMQGSLGWYYSDNNTDEAYVAADRYPYTRAEFWNDPLGRVRRSAGVGNEHKMGSGHEGRIYYMNAASELDYVFGSQALPAKKTIVVNAEGQIVVSFTDQAGRQIATAMSGLTDSCNIQKSAHILSREMPTRDMHIPDGHNSVQINLLRYHVELGDVNLRVYDLDSLSPLVEGVDYTIGPDLGSVLNYTMTFTGDYASGHHYLRFSFDYDPNFLDQYYNDNIHTTPPPEIILTQELDYSRWTLYFYEHDAKLLTKIIQPKGVDCESFDPVNRFDLTYFDNMGTVYDNGYLGANDQLVTSVSFYPDSLASTERHEIYFTLSNLAQDPQPHVDTTGLALWNACDGNTGYSVEPESNPITGYGVGPRWKEVADYLESTSVNLLAPQVGGKQVTMNASSAGFKQLLNEWDINDPCANVLHCFDGLLNCGETSIDYGPPCPGDPCYGITPQRAGTFRYEIKLYGIEPDDDAVQLNLDGDTSSESYYFYPVLYHTCGCEYFWDIGSLEAISGHLRNGDLSNYVDFEARLASIAFQAENSVGFTMLNPTSTNIHDYARFMVFRLQGNYRILDDIVEPTHNGFETTFAYTDLHQLATKTSVDEGTTEVVYDTQGKVKFTQNSLQKANEQFSYIHYDTRGRVLETGEFDYTDAGAKVQFQNHAETYTVTKDSTVLDKVDLADGLEDTYCSQQHYFNYDLPDAALPTALTGYNQRFVNGNISKTWNGQETTWYSYDEKGQTEWTVKYIDSLDKYFTMNYTYDYLGNLTETVHQEQDTAESFYHHYTYDANQRLTQVKTSEDGVAGTAHLEAAYEYALHGALNRTEIGTDLQGIDYVYTIGGRLKSINNPALNGRDPGSDSYAGDHSAFAQDVFGLTIDYHENDYKRKGTDIQTYSKPITGGYDDGYFDGRIKSVRWQTRTETALTSDSTLEFRDTMLMWIYDYDVMNQLAGAEFSLLTGYGTQNGNGLPSQSYEGPTSSIKTDFLVSELDYDLNGNITSLKREGNNTTGLSMDSLTYTYNSGKNQLQYIADEGSVGNYSDDLKDQGQNYTYNSIGQMTKDVEEENYLDYDVYGKVTTVWKNNARTIKKVDYTYNSSGQRIGKTLYDLTTSNVITDQVWYILDGSGLLVATYELDSTSTDIADLTIYGNNRVGFYDYPNQERRYELTDHLGNVRATIKGEKTNGEVVMLGMQDFYPYGMPMPGRQIADTTRAFGLGGKEKESEIAYTNFELRQYDPRVGRWLSPDPHGQFHSPYLAFANDPARFIDPDGGFTYDPFNGPESLAGGDNLGGSNELDWWSIFLSSGSELPIFEWWASTDPMGQGANSVAYDFGVGQAGYNRQVLNLLLGGGGAGGLAASAASAASKVSNSFANPAKSSGDYSFNYGVIMPSKEILRTGYERLLTDDLEGGYDPTHEGDLSGDYKRLMLLSGDLRGNEFMHQQAQSELGWLGSASGGLTFVTKSGGAGPAVRAPNKEFILTDGGFLPGSLMKSSFKFPVKNFSRKFHNGIIGNDLKYNTLYKVRTSAYASSNPKLNNTTSEAFMRNPFGSAKKSLKTFMAPRSQFSKGGSIVSDYVGIGKGPDVGYFEGRFTDSVTLRIQTAPTSLLGFGSSYGETTVRAHPNDTLGGTYKGKNTILEVIK